MKTRQLLSTLASTTELSLYRLSFVGGPWDGHETESAALPAKRLEVSTGPLGCATRHRGYRIPRRALYELRTVTLVNGAPTPVVQYRFEYCGTAIAERSLLRRWHQYFDAFWNWLEPRPSKKTAIKN